MTTLRVPGACIILLLGASGAGKSTFARSCFTEYEVISSDTCRAMIVDDAADQTVTAAAFNLVRYIAHLRIDAGRLAVIDATNVKPAARARMTRLAKRKLVPIFAIVLDFDADVCLNRNMRRRDRRVPDSVILNQIRELRDSLPSLLSEGFEDIVILSTPDELGRLRLVRSSSGK